MKKTPSLEGEIRWPRKVTTPAEAVRFIDATGFCLLFPIQRLPLPSLYYAVKAGKMHGGMGWDKDTAKMWGWKDELPRKRRAFYAKYFKMRGTFLSLRYLPHFIAMRGSLAAPGDYERFYAEGRIGDAARAIWETLEKHGPLATLELRHACKLDSKPGNLRFKRGMAELQCLLLVVHSGTAQETAAWASGRFELTARAFPKQWKEARGITPSAARTAIAAKYLEWHPDAPVLRVARLFGWTKEETAAALSGARA
jgi:hypothetical protein